MGAFLQLSHDTFLVEQKQLPYRFSLYVVTEGFN